MGSLKGAGNRETYVCETSDKSSACQLLEVHGNGCEQGLDFHIRQSSSNCSVQSMERFRSPVRAFETPSVPGIDGALVVTPAPPLAASMQTCWEVVRDMHAARRRTPRDAPGPERTGRTVLSVGTIPASGFRLTVRRQDFLVWTPHHVLPSIVFEALDGEAACILAHGFRVGMT